LILGMGTLGITSIAGCVDADDESRPEQEPDPEPEPETAAKPEIESDLESDSVEEEPTLEHLHGLTGFTWPSDSGGNYTRRYEWTAAGYEWWYEMDIPRNLSEYYKERYSRSRKYDMYVSDAYGEPYIQSLASNFEQMANRNGLNEAEAVNLVIRFVQNMKYTADDVRTGFDQYSQYPVENLIEQGGDCEDSSLLLSALLSQMGYGCVLLFMPDTEPEAHMAMGIKGSSSLPGNYYEFNGDRYYYVEGTDEYAVGEMPNWGGSTRAEIIPVRGDYPTLVYSYGTGVTNTNEIAVDVEITNQGGGSAQNTSFHVGFEDESGRVYAENSSAIGTLRSGESSEEVLYLTPPDDTKLRLLTSISISRNTHDIKRSEWQYPIM